MTAFRDGSRVLGRSALEAPAWMSARIERAARRWAESGGRTADPGDVLDADARRRRRGALARPRVGAPSRSGCGALEQSYLAGLVALVRAPLERSCRGGARKNPPPAASPG